MHDPQPSPASGHPRGPYPEASLYGRMRMPAWGPLVLFTLPGFTTLFFIGAVLAGIVSIGLGWLDLSSLAGGLDPSTSMPALKLIQAVTQLTGMALLAYLLALGTGSVRRELALTAPRLDALGWALLLLFVVACVPALSAFTLPSEWVAEWGSFGQWATGQEEQIEKMLLGFLAGNLWVNLLVIALVPALAEELLFRGWMQGSLARVMPITAAIWITAAVFSAIHLQVIGFIPRLLLGAGFGYLRWRTGSIWPAVFAHFVNNAVAVIAAHLALAGEAPREWLESDAQLPLGVTLGALALALAAGWALWRVTRQAPAPTFAPDPN